MKHAIATAAVCVALAACSSTPVAQVQPIDGVISGQCHSDMVRGALGLAASDATVAPHAWTATACMCGYCVTTARGCHRPAKAATA